MFIGSLSGVSEESVMEDTWGHMRLGKGEHAVKVLFVVYDSGWVLLDWISGEERGGPWLYDAVNDCVERVVERQTKTYKKDKENPSKSGFREFLPNGVYEMHTTYKEGRGCRYGKGFIKLNKIAKSDFND